LSVSCERKRLFQDEDTVQSAARYTSPMLRLPIGAVIS